MKRQPLYLEVEATWADLGPGTLIGISYGIVTVKSVSPCPDGHMAITVDGSRGDVVVIFHASNPPDIAVRNPKYREGAKR